MGRLVEGVAVILAVIGLPIVIFHNNTQHAIIKKAQDAYKEGINKTGEYPAILHNSGPTQENWIPPNETQPHIHKLKQGNGELIEYIAQNWLLPPSTLPLKLVHRQRIHYSQMQQAIIVDKLLRQKRNGFYIESGAANGEMFSNTLFFEKSRNWTGVLIEPDSKYFNKLVEKHRHAYLLNSCLSPTKMAVRMPFRIGGLMGGLTDHMSAEHTKRMDNELGKTNDTILVQCFPLYSILKAIGVSHVDFLSLDIEGAEPEVLRTLPLRKMTVDVFCIEHNGNAGKLAEIKDYLVKQHGYEIARQDWQDIYLVRKQMWDNAS